MNKITPAAPYDDDKMIWDEDTQQYQLKLDYCKEEFDVAYINDDNEDTLLKKRIKKNSRVVYRFITSRVNSYNRDFAFKLLNRTAEGRQLIFNMLYAQMESDIDSGYNDLTGSTAVNLSNGQIIPREELNRNTVSVATEEEWDNNQAYFGINLGYQGRIPPYYQILIRGL